jgi:hypothetical protein
MVPYMISRVYRGQRSKGERGLTSIGSTIQVYSSVSSILPSAAYVSSPMLYMSAPHKASTMSCRRRYLQLMRGEFGLDGRLDHLFHLFIRLCDQLSRQHHPPTSLIRASISGLSHSERRDVVKSELTSTAVFLVSTLAADAHLADCPSTIMRLACGISQDACLALAPI